MKWSGDRRRKTLLVQINKLLLCLFAYLKCKSQILQFDQIATERVPNILRVRS